jgi:hypothetical protein
MSFPETGTRFESIKDSSISFSHQGRHITLPTCSELQCFTRSIQTTVPINREANRPAFHRQTLVLMFLKCSLIEYFYSFPVILSKKNGGIYLENVFQEIVSVNPQILYHSYQQTTMVSKEFQKWGRHMKSSESDYGNRVK